MNQVGEEFTGNVSAIAFGGQGIVRLNGFVIFVPFSAPGDKVRGVITSRKKQFATGKIIELLESSPLRTTPLCPYYGTCGGCQLQHLSPEAQLDYKKNAIEEAFQRIAKLTDIPISPAVASPHPWAYRRHIKLHLQVIQGQFQAGYIGTDNQTLLPIQQCPIFLPAKNPIFGKIQTLLKKLHAVDGNYGQVTIIKQPHEKVLVAFAFNRMPGNIQQVMENALEKIPEWTGLIARSDKQMFEWGTAMAMTDLEGLHFHFSPFAFMQNHPEQSLRIYQSILDLAKKSEPKEILDLYCGIGISTLLLARHGFQTAGVESNPTAIALARNNAKLNNISTAAFIQADVGKILNQLTKNRKCELVIVNPPRAGLDDRTMRSLIAAAPREIIYISCMPSTLARDLHHLCQNNYKIHSIQPYDMFPQTAHVETVVHCSTHGVVV